MKLQAPTGMPDLFENTLEIFSKIEALCKKMANFYNFQKIKTPIVEKAELFERGTGPFTDIVQKQMFTFWSKGGEKLTLRPEITPAIVRVYFQYGLQTLGQPVNLWYFGPVFRYERPQAGRYRQFHQFGFESLGSKSPVIDSFLISIFYNILKEIGFEEIEVQINSIGDQQCRPYYKKILVTFLRHHQRALCQNCKKRLTKNPLRVLDCKEEKCQRIAKSAPPLIDHLCPECKKHFEEVLENLEALSIPYKLSPHLVRGLDYYTKTVFEIFAKEGKDQGALIGGGRYDLLAKMLKQKKELPACGGAGGVERIANSISKKFKIKEKKTKVFLAHLGRKAQLKALSLIESFRKAGLKISFAPWKESLSAQLKLADKQDVVYSLILGQKEVAENKIIIKTMKTGYQKTIPLKKVIPEVKKLLKK